MRFPLVSRMRFPLVSWMRFPLVSIMVILLAATVMTTSPMPSCVTPFEKIEDKTSRARTEPSSVSRILGVSERKAPAPNPLIPRITISGPSPTPQGWVWRPLDGECA